MTREAERARMVERLVEQGILHDARVIDAMRRVPRHRFVSLDAEAEAYVDAPFPLERGQTVSAPHMVAMMCEALDARPGQRVLEVGGGSGYHAAVLAQLVAPGGEVVSVERIPELATAAAARLATLAPRVRTVVADGSAGFPEAAPFDRIIVAAAAPRAPQPLLDQLAPGGSLVIPLGALDAQTLTRIRKDGLGRLESAPLCAVRFVPLLGAHGFSE